jgi:hypothetical protein
VWIEIFSTPFWADAQILRNKRKCERAVLGSNRLTFFSVSIHLFMAGTEDPVRSLRAPIASLTISIVDIVVCGGGGGGEGVFCVDGLQEFCVSLLF